MNETQSTYADHVRRGRKNYSQVCQDLEELEPIAYQNKGFREMLFAIDGMNRFQGPDWHSVFVRGLIEHSDWIADGRLLPRAYTEIADNHRRYGYGEYGMALVIDLYEEIRRKPVNAASFTRRTIREFFNGVQPLEDRVVFLVKRFFALQKPLQDDDLRLLFHIREESKGLVNDDEFDHFYASTIRDWVSGADSNGQRERLVMWHLDCIDEVTAAEKLLIRMLKDKQITVPNELLLHIDLSKDQLMGIV